MHPFITKYSKLTKFPVFINKYQSESSHSKPLSYTRALRVQQQGEGTEPDGFTEVQALNLRPWLKFFPLTKCVMEKTY